MAVPPPAAPAPDQAAIDAAVAAEKARWEALVADEKRKADEAEMTETQRLQTEAQRATARAAELENAAALTEVAHAIDLDLIAKGVAPTAAATYRRLVDFDATTNTPEARAAAIAAAEAKGVTFTTAPAAGPAPAPAPPGVPAAAPPASPPATDVTSLAHAQIRRMGLVPRSAAASASPAA